MTLVSFLLVILMVSNIGESGQPFHCFLCHQTSKECNNGVKMTLDVTACSTNKCFVLKYETEMPGVTVLATFRGCYEHPEYELLSSVRTEKHTVTKKHFHVCNATLCNKGVDTRLNFPIFGTLFLLQMFLIIVKYFQMYVM